MAYTAWEAMRKKNYAEHNIDFPQQPKDFREKKNLSCLERDAIAFLHDHCEELCFDKSLGDMSDLNGKSARLWQIPLNMERDTDRLCLERAIHRFMCTGASQDAFDVYFCYLEMFVGSYASCKQMIELLAEFESNASVLLMKHRDHYAHSVYVFVLGIAIYQKSVRFRNAYREMYRLEDDRQAAAHFLEHWGLTALFHDIGYPFELPFEQVKSYFGGTIERVPYVSYQGIDIFISLSTGEAEYFQTLLGRALTEKSLNAVLACQIESLFGKEYGITAQQFCNAVLKRKPSEPERFSGYMDHAYFSSVLLFRRIKDVKGIGRITKADLDCFTAIALHNSMFKFCIISKEHNAPLDMRLHPLAWLLMLSDELQCWDRVAYGQNSRHELHPMWCDICFEENCLHATYEFDKLLESRKDTASGSYRKMTDDEGSFVKSIEKIVSVNAPTSIGLQVSVRFAKNTHTAKASLSNSSFLHLYNFAVALNARYAYGSGHTASQEEMEAEFEKLSLEYKLSNILQAKNFSRYLEAIGCFYTDKAVPYELLTEFSEANMDVIGPMEHKRWLDEKLSMGWHFGTAYTELSDKTAQKLLREKTRTHCIMIEDYDELEPAEQDKDTEPMNSMLRLIEQYDGLRIYRV